MALEGPLGVSVLGLVPGEVPDDQAVVTATRKEHVGAKTRTRCQQIMSQRSPSSSSPASVLNEPSSDGSRFAIVRTYFSIEVASEVTQPFCSKSVSACSVDHRDPPPQRRSYMSGDAIGKKHHRRDQWETYVAHKGALENELLSHVARLDVGSRFEIGFGRGFKQREA